MSDNEKDRLGEKLRREKAAERCPTCGAALVAVERGGQTTHECPACQRPAR